MGFYNYLTEHFKWGITREDIVIDIGGGNDPILRANMIVEKYVDNDQERYSGLMKDRLILNFDGAKLPFKDKSIDFVHCRHVIEHVPDVEAFINEIQRVGKRGIIIAPHGDYEKLDPRDKHIWYVFSQDGQLVFKQKPCWDEFPDVSKYFRSIISLKGYWPFIGRHYEVFNTVFFWDDTIDFVVQRKGDFDWSKFTKAFNATKAKKHRVFIKHRIKAFVGKFFRLLFVKSRNDSVLLDSVIKCVGCGNASMRKGDSIKKDRIRWECVQCGAHYELHDSVVSKGTASL